MFSDFRYWTDNGACYHYYPGEVNYEDTILQVYEAAMQNNIPFRYLQVLVALLAGSRRLVMKFSSLTLGGISRVITTA